MYNNFVKPSSDSNQKREKRKPVAENFVPKRLACSYQPPIIILQYMVPDTGKLYHHKMRLETKMQQTFNCNKILQYLKVKHAPYFSKSNPKIKDVQILQLIEKIVSQYQQIQQNEQAPKETASSTKLPKSGDAPMIKDFDFLDGDQQDEQEQEYKQDWDLQMGQDADIV